VLTGDIIGSRKSEVQDLMDRLPTRLDEMNSEIKPVAGFAITGGDEIQGVLAKDDFTFDILIKLLAKLYPLKMKIGIGIGQIATELKPNPGEMRGEAFIHAREALQQLSKSPYLFRLNGEIPNLEVYNSFLALSSRIVMSWNGKTFLRYGLYHKLRNIVKVAEVEQVSPEAINKFLNRHLIKELIEVDNRLSEMLSVQPYRVE